MYWHASENVALYAFNLLYIVGPKLEWISLHQWLSAFLLTVASYASLEFEICHKK